MRTRVAIIYNQPTPSSYDIAGESEAAIGVLDAVRSVRMALEELRKFDVLDVPLEPPLEQTVQKVKDLKTDIVFNLFEGFCGHPHTEAALVRALEQAGLVHTGCPASALRTSLDKARANMILSNAGIPVPDCRVLNPDTLDHPHVTFPCIVKPRCEDASHGLSAGSICHDIPALKRQVGLICSRYYGGAVVERFLEGREFNATIIGSNGSCTVLPVSEIVYDLPPGMPHILTYESKWCRQSSYFKGTRPVCPADIGSEQLDEITGVAAGAFKLLIGKGYARVDMRTDARGRIHVIDVNPNPDISPGAGAVLQSREAGMDYPRFIERITGLALEKELS